MFVCHRCDNRRCVRPDHLWLGTVLDNQDDMARKGRAGQSKLSPHQVRAIRWIRAVTGEPHARVADRFGVSRNAIWSICKGKTYRHAGGPLS
jgi:hypothetical protein